MLGMGRGGGMGTLRVFGGPGSGLPAAAAMGSQQILALRQLRMLVFWPSALGAHLQARGPGPFFSSLKRLNCREEP